MASEPASTLRSRYVEQAAADLRENRRRQQELLAQIKVLKQEEALLSDILSLTERFPEPSDDRPPPPPQRTPGASDTARSRPGPLLGELLVQLLAAYDEPRPAKELRDELLERHPDRSPTPQVVRNTLESLVAKGMIRRHKAKRSVMYTLVRPTPRESGAGQS
ncbi:hypothetical protein ACWC10_34490 [Streptomyces sp. NPDC001595]|uniref:hypothetical protein n=1 Tax=Streptomyces sp. NPDC001532 TaxID=3154520 RepID=UPI0033335736